MDTWSKEELHKIAQTDDLHISPFREDGVTYGTPTWIWSVVVGDSLFVRAYHGQNSRWYQAAIRQKAGRITVAEFDHDLRNRKGGPTDGLYETREYRVGCISDLSWMYGLRRRRERASSMGA
nr:DUF2255 family protein [Cohnella thermotolerans]